MEPHYYWLLLFLMRKGFISVDMLGFSVGVVQTNNTHSQKKDSCAENAT
jgi:hypothetical protein